MSQDVIVKDTLHEAFELYGLQTNSSLLDYGLHMGLIERTTNGEMTIDSLNIKLMSDSQVVQSVLFEVLMRLGVYLSATGLVKLAIEMDVDDPDLEDTLKGFYVFSVFVHQMYNFDITTLFRSLNRSLMCIAIILFSLTTTNSRPCEDMKKFRHTIRHRLYGDYYLWCLLFSIDFVLTCSSPLYINIEQFYGIELNMVSNFITAYCVLHLSYSMQITGNGRLHPLILGTPLIFLDAGDNITLVKGLFLALYYLHFWCSDWRELADWHHSLIHDAGVCNVLNQKPYKRLHTLIREAKQKFDDWRFEEGLDDDGWFMLLDSPIEQRTNPTDSVNEDNANNDTNEDSDENSQNNEIPQPEQIDYTNRVIYLQSRNPLLVWLAKIILIVWK